MGAAWCRERAARAQDSKSPFDRVIVKCANQMSQSESQIAQNKAGRNFTSHIASSPVPPGKPSSNPEVLTSGWQEVVLRVPDPPAIPDKAPIAPPRRKKMNRAKQADVVAPLPAPRKPPTPTIFLEVDTPETKHRANNSGSTPPSGAESVVTTSEKRLSVAGGGGWGGGGGGGGWEGDLLRLPRRVSSTASMTSQRSITSVSDATTERLDAYLKSSRSFGSLRPEDMIVTMNQAQGSDASSDSDAWAGLDDWDLGIVDHQARTGTPPLTPTSQLSERKARPRATFTLGGSTTSGKPESRKKKAAGERKKKAAVVKKPVVDSDDSTNQPPANFKDTPDPTEDARTPGKIIKPSQIPLEDFLMQSTKTSLNEKRKCNLKVQVSSAPVDNSPSFSFDFNKGLAPPRSHSPQITLPGTPCTPRSLSRCSSPFPKQFADEQATTPSSSPSGDVKAFAWTPDEDADVAHSTLLRMLNEYRNTANMIGEEDARKLLNELGIPENLANEIKLAKAVSPDEEVEALGNVHLSVEEKAENGSGSDHSSMTPSLNELEVALSELLEASAAKEAADEVEPKKVESSGVPVEVTTPSVATGEASKDVKPEIMITICKADVGVGGQDGVVAEIESSFVPIKTEPVHVGGGRQEGDSRPEITITVAKDEGEASKEVDLLVPVKPMLRRSRTGDDLTKLEFQS